jgi:O-methyltransferase
MPQGTNTDTAGLYLDLMKGVLTGSVLEDSDRVLKADPFFGGTLRGRVRNFTLSALSRRGFELVKKRPYDAAEREEGRDWPSRAETMIGLKRMNNLQDCIETVLRDDVPGDLIETGVWRGGAVIFMRAVLKAHGDTDRTVWVADSFQGLPEPDPARYPADAGDIHATYGALRVGVDVVKHNFCRYGLLDDQVQFLVGWFADTLPTAPIERLSILRLDGDMYSSTMQAIEALYPKLSPGGFCIVDDYHLAGCREAIDDYRSAHGITDEIVAIDWGGVFWRKS